jgi:hypothetical protein
MSCGCCLANESGFMEQVRSAHLYSGSFWQKRQTLCMRELCSHMREKLVFCERDSSKFWIICMHVREKSQTAKFERRWTVKIGMRNAHLRRSTFSLANIRFSLSPLGVIRWRLSRDNEKLDPHESTAVHSSETVTKDRSLVLCKIFRLQANYSSR